MHIAVVGCGHGEIDKIYEVIASIEEQRGIKVSLLLCCGDFQSVRNMTDLRCMACPIKYQQMHDFHRYYSGEKKAPVLTLFIGGNHEASNFLQELPYGGWVAPNMFYLGYVGVVRYGGVRIAGISGIYKGQDYLKGRYEAAPYNQGTMRSVYHYRNLDIFRLKQIKKPVDIILSHDWPKGIHQHGNVFRLLKRKPFFADEIHRNELGSRPLSEVLEAVKPNYWFSAHMHVKFAALVRHQDKGPVNQTPVAEENENDSASCEKQHDLEVQTKFLALDKVLPRRQFLQIIEIPVPVDSNPEPEYKFEYDPEWLTILSTTNHLVSTKEKTSFMPGPGGNSRFDFTATADEINEVLERFQNDMSIPSNFCQTSYTHGQHDTPREAHPLSNPQTKDFCQKLGVTDPLQDILDSQILNPLLNVKSCRDDMMGSSQHELTWNETSTSLLDSSANPDEISLDLEDESEDVSNAHSMQQEGQQEAAPRRKLNLPPPKASGNSTESETLADEPAGSSTKEMDILRSVMGEMEEEDESAGLFFIDRGGEPSSKRPKGLGSYRY